MIEARVILDSITEDEHRLITFVGKFPRFCLAELNTHRALSRNSASSRAIPQARLIKRIEDQLALPVTWGKNQAGMQAEENVGIELGEEAESVWRSASIEGILHAKKLADIGIHKQIANRLLEPFFYTEAIISATELGNFFNLRCHKDAQPEFQELAFCMLQAYVDSTPKLLKAGEWHIPFGDKYIEEGLTLEQQIKIGVARCARVSYLNFEGEIKHEKDYQLHDDLLASGHMSPFEHVAKAQSYWECHDYGDEIRENPRLVPSGNFIGWQQYRKTLPNENRIIFDPIALLATRKKRT